MQILTDATEVLVGTALPPQTVTATAQGSSVDMTNYEVSTGAKVTVGAQSAGLTAGNVQIEEWSGTTADTWTLIPNMLCTLTTVTTGQQYKLIGLRTHRYARANVVTATGTTINSLMSVELLAMPKSSQSPTGYSRSPSV